MFKPTVNPAPFTGSPRESLHRMSDEFVEALSGFLEQGAYVYENAGGQLGADSDIANDQVVVLMRRRGGEDSPAIFFRMQVLEKWLDENKVNSLFRGSVLYGLLDYFGFGHKSIMVQGRPIRVWFYPLPRIW